MLDRNCQMKLPFHVRFVRRHIFSQPTFCDTLSDHVLLDTLGGSFIPNATRATQQSILDGFTLINASTGDQMTHTVENNVQILAHLTTAG